MLVSIEVSRAFQQARKCLYFQSLWFWGNGLKIRVSAVQIRPCPLHALDRRVGAPILQKKMAKWELSIIAKASVRVIVGHAEHTEDY